MKQALSQVRPGELYRHLKRGTVYEVWATAVNRRSGDPLKDGDIAIFNIRHLMMMRDDPNGDPAAMVNRVCGEKWSPEECVFVSVQASERPIESGDVVVIYESKDGALFARREEEFLDGRFELIGINQMWDAPDLVIETPVGRYKDGSLRRAQLILSFTAVGLIFMAILAFVTAGEAP